MEILITGAAGNLGSTLARHMLPSGHALRLMVHRTALPSDLSSAANVSVVHADLSRPETLAEATDGVDALVHFAGVLFRPCPDRFLPETNTRWFANLLDASLKASVPRVVLISFPHVEGPTSLDAPARGRLDVEPISAHARTRLEEERLLFRRTEGTDTTPVVLRLGAVYGPGILMVEAARWLARRRLLAVWKEPTLYHFLSTADYLAATQAALLEPGIQGIYHVGDERPVTLQHFLDGACGAWGVRRPWRVPLWTVYAAASCSELFAWIFRTRSPLTRDFITIGRVPHCGDTGRAREELVPVLRHPTVESGLQTLR